MLGSDNHQILNRLLHSVNTNLMAYYHIIGLQGRKKTIRQKKNLNLKIQATYYEIDDWMFNAHRGIGKSMNEFKDKTNIVHGFVYVIEKNINGRLNL